MLGYCPDCATYHMGAAAAEDLEEMAAWEALKVVVAREWALSDPLGRAPPNP